VGEGRLEAKTYDFLPGARGRRGLIHKLEVTRYLGFFIWKILLPLVPIVSMSWAVFWVDPVEHGPQLGITVTSMLTLMPAGSSWSSSCPNFPTSRGSTSSS
jgi:hypothetical protein